MEKEALRSSETLVTLPVNTAYHPRRLESLTRLLLKISTVVKYFCIVAANSAFNYK
jgi:hypothetical protein